MWRLCSEVASCSTVDCCCNFWCVFWGSILIALLSPATLLFIVNCVQYKNIEADISFIIDPQGLTCVYACFCFRRMLSVYQKGIFSCIIFCLNLKNQVMLLTYSGKMFVLGCFVFRFYCNSFICPFGSLILFCSVHWK